MTEFLDGIKEGAKGEVHDLTVVNFDGMELQKLVADRERWAERLRKLEGNRGTISKEIWSKLQKEYDRKLKARENALLSVLDRMRKNLQGMEKLKATIEGELPDLDKRLEELNLRFDLGDFNQEFYDYVKGELDFQLEVKRKKIEVLARNASFYKKAISIADAPVGASGEGESGNGEAPESDGCGMGGGSSGGSLSHLPGSAPSYSLPESADAEDEAPPSGARLVTIPPEEADGFDEEQEEADFEVDAEDAIESDVEPPPSEVSSGSTGEESTSSDSASDSIDDGQPEAAERAWGVDATMRDAGGDGLETASAGFASREAPTDEIGDAEDETEGPAAVESGERASVESSEPLAIEIGDDDEPDDEFEEEVEIVEELEEEYEEDLEIEDEAASPAGEDVEELDFPEEGEEIVIDDEEEGIPLTAEISHLGPTPALASRNADPERLQAGIDAMSEISNVFNRGAEADPEREEAKKILEEVNLEELERAVEGIEDDVDDEELQGIARDVSVQRGTDGGTPPPAVLEVVEGANLGKVFPLNRTSAVTSIGKAPDNTVALPEDRALSRYHAKIIYRNSKFSIMDLDSTNGTGVNGEAITEADIDDEDEVIMGSSRYIFRLTGGCS